MTRPHELSRSRSWAMRRFEASLTARARSLDDATLARATMVIAPHPDDETLGCGGTIARVRALGAPVVVVACTDGSRSHRHLMAPSELRRLREGEFRAACSALGVDPIDVHLLGHEDGSLAAAVDGAAASVAHLLREREIRRLLVPFRAEGIADHLAARRLGLLARAGLPWDIEVLEYPVWFWHVWPFVRPEVHAIRPRLRAVSAAWRAHRNARALTVVVDIGDHLATKRAALACHHSQTSRLVDDPRWLTLSDVADGDWLARLMLPRECFAPL